MPANQSNTMKNRFTRKNQKAEIHVDTTEKLIISTGETPRDVYSLIQDTWDETIAMNLTTPLYALAPYIMCSINNWTVIYNGKEFPSRQSYTTRPQWNELTNTMTWKLDFKEPKQKNIWAVDSENYHLTKIRARGILSSGHSNWKFGVTVSSTEPLTDKQIETIGGIIIGMPQFRITEGQQYPEKHLGEFLDKNDNTMPGWK